MRLQRQTGPCRGARWEFQASNWVNRPESVRAKTHAQAERDTDTGLCREVDH
jgi:hypothetical protein